MNQFFHFLYVILLTGALVLSLGSCRQDTLQITTGSVSVVTSTRPLHADCLENRFVAIVHCSGRGWTASCASPWVELSVTQGVDGDYVYFDVEENPLDDKRYAVVRFYDIDAPDLLSDYVEIVQRSAGNSDNALLTSAMARKHRLGFGYDIFGDYNRDESFSKYPVLEYEAMKVLESDCGVQIVTEDLRHVEELEIISANTLTELRSKLTKSETVGGGFLGCGKTTTENTTIFKSKTGDQECGMIRLKQIVTSRTIDLGAVYSVIRQSDSNLKCPLYAKEFSDALIRVKEATDGGMRQDALRNIYKQYGSHFVLSADLGGEIRVNTVVYRETSVESTHSVKTISKKIFGKKVSGSTSVYDKYQEDHNIRYQIEMTITGGSKASRDQISSKVNNFNIDNPITNDEIINWQNSFQLPTNNQNADDYNASLVNCRLIPLYDIINDPEVASAYKEYILSLNKQQMDIQEPDQQTSAVFSLEGLHPASSDSPEEDLYSKCIRVNDTLRAVIGSEYIPAIRSDRPCLVAYPIVAGRPFMYCGVFVGDSSHLPGFVRWLGNNCVYEPVEAFASDSLGYKGLLDTNGQLKSLYLYWGAVQMVPDEMIQCRETKQISTARMHLPVDVSTKGDPNVVKVGPYYWVRQSLVPKKSSNEIMKNIEYQGAFYSLTGTSPDTWSSTDYGFNQYLPSSTQARSVMAILNGRTDKMENSYFTHVGTAYSNTFVGANMLGLNWPRGYIAVETNANHDMIVCDGNSWVIPTFEGNHLCITRLSLSGNAVTMNYGDYIQSVGYLDSQFEKYNPFFFCTDEVY